MAVQAKILRVLKLISLLKSRSKTIPQIAAILEITGRSVYRYLDLLEEVGFIIDKDFENRYFIHVEEDEKTEFSFTTEESVLLKNLIISGTGNHPLKDNLLKKLYLNSDLKSISGNLEKARLSGLVSRLTEAIATRKQVILKQYHSAHSNEIRDRLIEPFELSEDYENITAYDNEDNRVKHFKLERVGEVYLLNKKQKNIKSHTISKTDMFGLSGNKETWVKLELELRPYLLLREEYPKSLPYLKKEEGKYYFYGPVFGFEGITRFVMGLIDSIRILGPPAFKKHIKSKILEMGTRLS